MKENHFLLFAYTTFDIISVVVESNKSDLNGSLLFCQIILYNVSMTITAAQYPMLVDNVMRRYLKQHTTKRRKNKRIAKRKKSK